MRVGVMESEPTNLPPARASEFELGSSGGKVGFRLRSAADGARGSGPPRRRLPRPRSRPSDREADLSPRARTARPRTGPKPPDLGSQVRRASHLRRAPGRLGAGWRPAEAGIDAGEAVPGGPFGRLRFRQQQASWPVPACPRSPAGEPRGSRGGPRAPTRPPAPRPSPVANSPWEPSAPEPLPGLNYPGWRLPPNRRSSPRIAYS
jgi:hypothetical protein